jgi:hypothetical protein
MHGLAFPFLGAFLGVGIIFTLWSLFWKGMALWHASKNKQPIWFIALLIIHTAGILDIVYLVFFRADRNTRSFGSLFDMNGVKEHMSKVKIPTTSAPEKKEADLPTAESSPE